MHFSSSNKIFPDDRVKKNTKIQDSNSKFPSSEKIKPLFTCLRTRNALNRPREAVFRNTSVYIYIYLMQRDRNRYEGDTDRITISVTSKSTISE